MSPTRSMSPIQIYQDASETMMQHPHDRPRPHLAPSAMPLQPMHRNVQPMVSTSVHYSAVPAPASAPTQFSPLKSQHFHASSLDYTFPTSVPPPTHLPESAPLFQEITSLGVPSAPIHYPQPPPPPPHQQQMFNTFDLNFDSLDRTGFQLPLSQPQQASFPRPQAGRQSLKRSYSDAAVVQTRDVKRAREDAVLPSPEDMPVMEDNGQKPPYSYAQMIGMAILRAPDRRLTLNSIYEWISSTFLFYRENASTGWHNSIRHNLSLNKAFNKQERPKGDAGKGSYWVIAPGMELQFHKDKPRKPDPMRIILQHNATVSTIQALPQPPREIIANQQQWVMQSRSDLVPSEMPPRPQTAPALPDLSSDATLPDSDPALHADQPAPTVVPDLSTAIPPPSSPPIINSSPPIAVERHHRAISSPTLTSRKVDKKAAKLAAVGDDSGYFSSLESSIRRPKAQLLSSELGLDRGKVKPGSAEEEIARIRSSSITPSHTRFRSLAEPLIRSSSPDRAAASLNPTTPAEIFKKPIRPPQSVSPNTQLRKHREAMSAFLPSPTRLADPFTEHESLSFESYSPAFKVDTPMTAMTHFDDSFLTYDFTLPGTPLALSPLKLPSAKRGLHSSARAGILTDATRRQNAMVNIKTPKQIPGNFLLKPTANVGPLGSPLKKGTHFRKPEMYNDENVNSLFDFGSFADENSEGEEFDISQGFAKITGTSTNTSVVPLTSNSAGLTRPGLGRSLTTKF